MQYIQLNVIEKGINNTFFKYFFTILFLFSKNYEILIHLPMPTRNRTNFFSFQTVIHADFFFSDLARQPFCRGISKPAFRAINHFSTGVKNENGIRVSKQ